MTDIVNRLVTELQGYITAPSLGGWVALGLYALAAVLVLVGLFKGLGRGMNRQLVRTVTVIISMVLSVWLCMQLAPHVLWLCKGTTLGRVLEKLHLSFLISGKGALTPIASSIKGIGLAQLAALPMSVIALPGLMVVSFMIISALMLLVHALICYVFGWASYCNNIFTRTVGAVVGAVQGGIVALFLFIGLFSATAGLQAMASEAPTDSRVYTTYTDIFAEADGSVLAKAVRKCGGQALHDAMQATVIVERKEAVDPKGMAVSTGAILGYAERLVGADFKELTPEQVEALRAIVTYTDSCPDTAKMMGAIVRSAAQNIGEYEALLPFKEPFLTTLTDFISAQSTTDSRYVVQDLSAIFEAYIALMECGVLRAESTAEAIECLSVTDPSGATAVERAYDSLYENERTRPLVRSLAEYTLLLLADGTDVARDGIFNELHRDLVLILSTPMPDASEAERALAIAAALQTSYADRGLSGDFERFHAMATYMLNVYGDVAPDELTEAQLCDSMLAFFHLPQDPQPRD